MAEVRSWLIARLLIVVVGLAASAWAQGTGGSAPHNRRIVGPDGAPADGTLSSLSDDGRFLAFGSAAPTLVPGDDNQREDVFVYDRTTRGFDRATAEIKGEGWFYPDRPAISGNGRVVAFAFHTAGEERSSTVYVQDRTSRRTVRIASGSAPSINGDGRYLAFQSDDPTLVSDTNDAPDIFVFDRITSAITRVSTTRTGIEGNAGSVAPILSANGRKVLFLSEATNLVSGDTNGVADLFLKDLRTGAISRVNVGASGQANAWTNAGALSADGQVVVFSSFASNLVTGDTNQNTDIFVRDLAARTTTRVSVDSFGRQADDWSSNPMTNASGRYVLFWSSARNLVRDAMSSAILLHDRTTGVTQQVDLDARGNPAGDEVSHQSFSGNGRFLAMSTFAPLAEDDANAAYDLYLRDLGTLSLVARFQTLEAALQDVNAPGALQTALGSARTASDTGDRTAGCRAMTQFEWEVQARWNRDVPSAQAETLFNAAGAIGRQLGCLDAARPASWFSTWTVPVAEPDARRGSSNDRLENVFTGDVNGDGRLDVVTDAAQTLIVLAGDGAGSFRSIVNTGIAGVIWAAADLNADGRTDLVVSDGDAYAVRVLISELTAAVAFTETRVELGDQPSSVAIGDLTGDGHVDIVVGTDRGSRITVIAGAGSGRFATPQPIETGYSPARVAIADLTGDGRVDLVYQEGYSSLFLVRGTGGGLPQTSEYLGAGISNFRLADVDGDNAPEVIAWQPRRAEVYRFDNGLRLVSTVAGRQILNLSVADLTDDDRADLVIFEWPHSYATSGVFSIVHGNGDGTFGMRVALSTRVASGSVSIGDMNRDGRADLVLATEAGQRGVWFGPAGVSLLLNRPAVFIETPNEKTVVGIGTVVRITWVHALAAGSPFRVDVSRDEGKTWATVAPRVLTNGSKGRYAWTVTGPSTTRARFRVASLGSASRSDVNNSTFSIGAPSMTLHAPRAGENWGIGTDRRVVWSHNLGLSERVHVDLSRDDGRTWTRIASNFRLNGTTSARFATVPTGPETAAARVRISWARDPSLNAVSRAFRIGVPFIRIVEPVPGTRHPRCTHAPLAWRHNLGAREHVNVDVSYDAGGTWDSVPVYSSNGASFWVSGPEVKTGMVRVTWRKDDSVIATVGDLALGHDEGYSCEPDEE